MKVLDEVQLTRIEAVHRGFLYQHLYAASCLLKAPATALQSIVVESDEDIELILPDRRIYMQVKTRSDNLAFHEVSEILDRFSRIRAEHENGNREGDACFAILSNAPPAPKLLAALEADDWPDHVELYWPGGPAPKDSFLIPPPCDLTAAVENANELAAELPNSLLKPETLTWKLASIVMMRAAGSGTREDHAFSVEELPELFEQLLVQMHQLPEPPPFYRPQLDEPPLLADQSSRIVAGLSGAGKTAWVAQSALHLSDPVTYLDVLQTPGSALASAVARETAATVFGNSAGVLGEILLPGATGLDLIGALNTKLRDEGFEAHVIIDNAHRLPAEDIKALIDRAPNIRFLLLCQPGEDLEAIEAALNVRASFLGGWDEDTIASVFAEAGCAADVLTCELFSRLTGGLPFYILNAAAVAVREYGGSIAAFAADIDAQTQIASTALEVILRRALEGLPHAQRETIAILSLADVALSREDAAELLQSTLEISERETIARLRDLPRSGALELFGNAGLKIHDAIRPFARTTLLELGEDFELRARRELRAIIMQSLLQDWSIGKLALLIRLFGQLGEAMPLVQIATDELFHEMGVWPEIEPFLVELENHPDESAENRFWALDGLVFNDLREGNIETALRRIDGMEALLEDSSLGDEEWLAWAMKRMLSLSNRDDVDQTIELMDSIESRLPDRTDHLRIFRYNRALSLFKMDAFEIAANETEQLVSEYYDALGLSPADIMGRNGPEIRPLLPQDRDITDDLKHLADTLDLRACALEGSGSTAGMCRIHAMKFYELANAPQSFVRVGQDFVDELVARHDFTSAREVIEANILPNLQAMNLIAWALPVRSQYAVVLAYCGDQEAAEAEMGRLAPYAAAAVAKAQQVYSNQRALIDEIGRNGPPPQLEVNIPPNLQNWFDQRRGLPSEPVRRTKIGRNEKCPCGSGKKFKHCHGR
jgi:hypothetical protein